MKKTRYHEILRDDIRDFVSLLSYNTMDVMIVSARERAIELKL